MSLTFCLDFHHQQNAQSFEHFGDLRKLFGYGDSGSIPWHSSRHGLDDPDGFLGRILPNEDDRKDLVDVVLDLGQEWRKMVKAPSAPCRSAPDDARNTELPLHTDVLMQLPMGMISTKVEGDDMPEELMKSMSDHRNGFIRRSLSHDSRRLQADGTLSVVPPSRYSFQAPSSPMGSISPSSARSCNGSKSLAELIDGETFHD